MRRFTIAGVAALLMALSGASAVLAQDASDVSLDSPIRSIKLAPGEVRAELDLDLKNEIDERRIVTIALLDTPENWDVGVWNAFYDFEIFEFVVEPVDDTPGQRPRLRVDIPDDPAPEPGPYSFTIVIADAEAPSIVYDRAKFTISISEPEVKELGEVILRTDFPIFSGPASQAYQFEVVVQNETGEQQTFELSSAVGLNGVPQQGWDINFTPAFGDQKQIRSLSLLGAVDERVNVNVTPPRFTAPGDYTILIVAEGGESGEFTDTAVLGLSVTGRGEVDATTPTGLLSMDATAGEPASGTIRLSNIGSGDLDDVSLLSDIPPGWVVTFVQDNVPSILANGVPVDINFFVTPPDDAVPGDYIVTLSARSAAGSTSFVDFRVTVDQSTIWGWLGLVLVLAAVGGLGGLFWRLGRR
jgi:uncharacterized membrane protein